MSDDRTIFCIMKNLFELDEIWKDNAKSIANILRHHDINDNDQISVLIRIETEEYFECKEFYLIATYFRDPYFMRLYCVFAKDLEEVKRKFEIEPSITLFHCIFGNNTTDEYVLDINKTLSKCFNYNMSGKRLKPFLTSFDKSNIEGVNDLDSKNEE